MPIDDKFKTVLLDDTPADSDSFGTHARVAKALGNLIRSDTPGGKVLGLEGGWGAGKTTVVRLLRQDLSEANGHVFATFDTWAHEGDPLRRTFLESLIGRFLEEGWVDRESWKKKLDEIACRRKETTKKTIPKPTWLGKLFAVSVLVVPFGSTLLSSALRDGATFEVSLSRPVAWQLLLGTALSLSWAVVLGLNAVRYLYLKGRDRSTEDAWHFLLSHTISDEITSTIETPDPTSVEFERYFTELLAEGLGGKEGRRLVVVLDNLDRVDVAHGLTLWSTLQTFLQDRDQGRPTWFDRLWIIVPYDEDGIRKLWDQGGEDTSAFFLDKVFSLRLRVPQLLLENWREYLLDQAQRAFPGQAREDLRPLLSVFEIQRTEDQSQPPTPRSIKVYLNQVGSIIRQWQDTFPIAHVGYYVVLSRQRTDVAAGLLKGELPAEPFAHVLGPRADQSLAGLHFNVEPHTGQQLLLGDAVLRALTEPNSEALAQLAEVHGSGFYAVLGNVSSVRLAREGGKTSCRAALSLSDADLKTRSPEFSVAISTIRRSVGSETEWNPLDSTSARGIAALLQLVNDPAESKELVERISNGLPRSPSEETMGGEYAANLVSSWLTIVQAAANLGHDGAASISIVIPCDGDGWVAACEVLAEADSNGQFRTLFSPSLSKEQVATYFEDSVAAGTLEEDQFRAILTTSELSQPPDWKGVLVAIRERLQAASAAKAPEAGILLEALLELRLHKVREDAAQAQTFDEAGHYLHHLHTASAEKDSRALAACVFLSMSARPTVDAPPVVGHSAQGHAGLTTLLSRPTDDLVERLVALGLRHATLQSLVAIAAARGEWDPLMVSWLRASLAHEDAGTFFNAETVASSWVSIMDALEGESPGFGELIAILQENDSLGEVLRARDFEENPLGLLYHVAASENTQQVFLNWCAKGLEQHGSEAWVKGLNNKSWAVQLLDQLKKRECLVNLSTQYMDAHEQYAKGLLSGDAELHPRAKSWSMILDCLGEGGVRKDLQSRLLRAAAEVDGEIPDAFFTLYGDEVSQAHDLANGKTVRELFAPIVNERSQAGMEWLRSLLVDHDGARTACSDTSESEVLHARLADVAADTEEPDEVRQLAVEIAKTLGVELALDPATGDEEES